MRKCNCMSVTVSFSLTAPTCARVSRERTAMATDLVTKHGLPRASVQINPAPNSLHVSSARSSNTSFYVPIVTLVTAVVDSVVTTPNRRPPKSISLSLPSTSPSRPSVPFPSLLRHHRLCSRHAHATVARDELAPPVLTPRHTWSPLLSVLSNMHILVYTHGISSTFTQYTSLLHFAPPAVVSARPGGRQWTGWGMELVIENVLRLRQS